MIPQILSEEQVAEKLGCAVSSVRQYVREGRLRATRYGDGGYRFSERLLIEDLERECNGNGSPPPTQNNVIPIGVAVAMPAARSGPPRLVPMMEVS